MNTKEINDLIRQGYNKKILEKYDLNKLNDAALLDESGLLKGFKDENSFEGKLSKDIEKRFENPIGRGSIYIPHSIVNAYRTMLLTGDSAALESLNQFQSKYLWDLQEVRISKAIYPKLVSQYDVEKGIFIVNKNVSVGDPGPEWLAEGFGNDESDINLSEFDKVSPLCLSVRLRFTKIANIYLREQGINFLIAAGIMAMDKKIDATLFYGSGMDGEPTGLSENEDVQDTGGGGFDLGTAAAMIRMVETSGGDYENINFVGSPTARQSLCQREIVANTGRMILENDKILNRNFLSTNGISGDDLWCGNFDTVALIRFFGGLEISVNPFSGDKEGIINLFIRMYCNLAVRNGSVIVRAGEFS